MLRLLVSTVCVLTLSSVAQPLTPLPVDETGLTRAQTLSQQALAAAEAQADDPDFLHTVQTQRQGLDAIPHGPDPSLYDLSGLAPEISEDFLLAKALAAGAPPLPPDPSPGATAPIVLVSLSMPVAILQSLIREAATVGAKIALRGAVDNDIGKTIAAMQPLMEARSTGGIHIDPTWFRRFQVNTVPTFILPLAPVRPCDAQGCEAPAHIKAHGTASLRYFLQKVSRLGNEPQQAAAERWLNRYRGETHAPG